VVPPVSPPPIVVPPVSPTTTTPEPATLATGLLGLAAVAGYRLVRRKEKDGDAEGAL
jgi:MYXO-CTERM domain-containing protein